VCPLHAESTSTVVDNPERIAKYATK
jgi:hypothetical protein